MPTAQLEPLIQRLRSAAALDTTSALSDGQLLARFATDRDEAAFATLVRRHGPMVLAACRRLLRDWHAAQDAFQATFLVLARKAASLREPELLARWLHGVACRTAARARADAARRRQREGRAAPPRVVDPDEGLLWRELRPVLDEEIARLPARQGAAVVLCYLEGRTNAEAGRRLGCSRGTVATLLARARQQLRRRLTGKGLALPAGLLAAGLTEPGRAAGVPLTLTGSTVKAAVAFAAGGTRAVGPVAARAAALAEGVIQTMMVKKFKLVAALLLLAGVVGTGAGFLGYRAAAEEPAAAQAGPAPRTPAAEAIPAAPAVRRTAPPPEDEAFCRTENFMVRAPSREVAVKVGRAAERARKAQAQLWLGKELPNWAELCPVRVKITERETGGVTSFQFAEGKATVRRMELQGPLENILTSALPHEVTHAVLGHWYGRGLPRWADEGAAIMAEGLASRKRHEEALHGLLKEGRLIPLRQLLPRHDYPRDAAALHAQGYSLTDFLVQAGDRKKFLAFVVQGEQSSWDKAVQKHYGYRTVEELETAWLAQVRKDLKTPPVAEPPVTDPPLQGVPFVERLFENRPEQKPSEPTKAWPRPRLPAGPAPVQVLAVVMPDGRMIIRREQPTYYVPQTARTERGQLVTSYTAITTTVEQRYDLQWVRVFDTRGKEVPRERLARLLKTETVVLASADGRPVDPLHLRLLKEDTLIVVLPAPQAPTPGVPLQATPALVSPPLPAPVAPPAVGPAVPVTPPAFEAPRPVQPPERESAR
jgi:RNA polymerase sigma factor (sigma-70 family)